MKVRYGQHSAGFTLVEILVVLVIIALISAVAVPAFRGANSEEKVSRNTAVTLRQYLRSARTYAIENRVKTAICYMHRQRNIDDVDRARWNGYVMIYEDPFEGWKQLRGSVLQERVVLHHAAYLRPGRFVEDVTSSPPGGMLDAFDGRLQGIYKADIKGYSAFRPSGMGTLYDGDWLPLTGQSEMRVFDECLGEDIHMAVRVVNSTGNVRIEREVM